MPTDDRTRSVAQKWRRVDDVLLVVALAPLAPAIFALWLATRGGTDAEFV